MRGKYGAVLGVIAGLSVCGSALAEGQKPAPRMENDWMTSREALSTTRAMGLANAMAASSSGTSAVWHNPAGITSAIMYAVDAGYYYDNDVDGHGFEVNVVDMKSNQYVGAGIGFTYQYSNPSDPSQHALQARLGIAVPLADNMISLGVSAIYSYIKYDGKQFMSQFTMDAGLVIRPLKWLSLGVAAQNLIVGDYDQWMPRMISAGVAFGSIDLGLNVMFETSFNLSADDIAATGSYGAGIEYTFKNMVPVRVGYRYEQHEDLKDENGNKRKLDDHHVLAVGLGYRHGGGIFGMDLSYQHHFGITNDLFSATFNFYF